MSPSSSRIQQDVSRVLQSLEIVLDAKGCIIDENIRTGRHYEKKENDIENKRWGGKRLKSSQDDYLLHLKTQEMDIHNDAISMLVKKDNDFINHD